MDPLRTLKEIHAPDLHRKIDLLTVLCTDAVLRRDDDVVPTLFTRLNDENHVCTNSRERRDHFAQVDRQWFADQLDAWHQRAEPVAIATADHPLEVISGDLCLILDLEGEEEGLVVSVLRDIYPKGWLLPGGCPHALEELLHPRRIAWREGAEEILITDYSGRRAFLINPEADPRPCLKKQGVEVNEMIALNKLDKKELAPRGKGDAQRIAVEYGGAIYKTDAAIRIDPQTGSAALTLYWRVEVPLPLSNIILRDGEALPDGSLIKRAIRLTGERSERLAALFAGGQNALTAGWISESTSQQANPPVQSQP